MADNYVKGLNTTGGDNHWRFQGVRERTKVAGAQVARRVRADHEQEALPDAVSFHG